MSAPGQSFEYHDMTLLPVRCFSCGKILGGFENAYKAKLKEGKTPEVALNELKIIRSCCRFNVMNPPQIPLALQIDNQAEEIVKLYNSFNIDEKGATALSVNRQNVDIVNLTGDPFFNPRPLTNANRPRRIYELSKRKITEKLYDSEQVNQVGPHSDIFENINTELLEENVNPKLLEE